MCAAKMHADEVRHRRGARAPVARRAVPAWADLPISAVRSTATVNDIYRLGDHLYMRLPRVQGWAQDLDKECRWLPKLAPRLSLRVPEPVRRGALRAPILSLGRSTDGSTASHIRMISLTMNTRRPETLPVRGRAAPNRSRRGHLAAGAGHSTSSTPSPALGSSRRGTS